MGCSASTSAGSFNEQPKNVDPRLPFKTYRQMFNLRNSWKAVARDLENVAMDCFVMFFKSHPEYQEMLNDIKTLKDEKSMRESMAFESLATGVFNIFDDFVETMETDLSGAIARLKMAGSAQRSDGFKDEMYQDLEFSFIESVKALLGDRYNEKTDENFHNLFAFVTKHMKE